MVVHAGLTNRVSIDKTATPQFLENLLCEQDSRGKVVPQSKHFGNVVVPIQEVRIDVDQISTGEQSTRRVENVQRLVNELTQLAKTFVYRSNIRWLLA